MLALFAMHAAWGGAGAAQPADSPIRCEFRVFDGDQEVTAETMLTVYPSGKREGGWTLEPAERLQRALPAGLYDVQAVRQREGKVVSIKWAERLVVMHYPDEAGFHLEVINFAAGYGALQLRPTLGAQIDLTTFEARATKAGARGEEAARGVHGEGYLLVVLPAGTYDIQIRPRETKEGRGVGTPAAPGVSAAAMNAGQWITAIEVPAARTRLKILKF
ncbi:MAG: hypothetical protein HY654_10955 [Acidobacteria bacterium]|nr:hypothetical protein [Acidobacteriota bacterium]